VNFVRGEGVYLYDGAGRRYLDFISGIGVVSLGHSHPRLVEALSEQAKKLIHVSNLYENPWQEELARRLIERFGEGRVFFCNSGTEANEAAIKTVRRYFRIRGEDKFRIIVFENAFHGRTYGSLSATPQRKFHEGFEPMLEGFDVAKPSIESVEALVGEKTAGVMIEVIQGEGGVRVMDEAFLKDLQDLCRERGILLIVDEVQTGTGRTGRFFAYEHFGIEPDLVTLAKGLGGGFPIGALIAKPQVAEVMGPGSHGSTFGGNALACSAGIVVVDEVSTLLERITEVGGYFMKRLEDLSFGEVRGKGLMIGVELDSPCTDLVLKALERGLLVNCTAEKVLRFLPPLITNQQHVDECIDILRGVV
jgi:acetylornithine aminotransferase/acetylornithine/N-succinyldiaminopimelate aminotransferase